MLLGEVSKFVSVSPARFTAVSASAGNLTLSVRGAAGEEVAVLVRKPASATLTGTIVRVGASGTGALTIKA